MKIRKAILILSIPTMLAACGQAEEEHAEEAKEHTAVAQEVDDSAENAKEEQEAEEEAERQAAAKKQAEQEAAEEKAAAEEADRERVQGYKEEAFLEQGRESMAGTMHIEFSQIEKAYYLYPTDPAVITEINNLVMYGQGMEDWNYMVESLVVLSEAAQQVVGEGYRIMFMNPVNEENVLIIIEDGQTIYNAADEL